MCGSVVDLPLKVSSSDSLFSLDLPFVLCVSTDMHCLYFRRLTLRKILSWQYVSTVYSFILPMFILRVVPGLVINIPLFTSIFDIFIVPFWLCFPFHPFRLNGGMLVKYFHKCLDKGLYLLERY